MRLKTLTIPVLAAAIALAGCGGGTTHRAAPPPKPVTPAAVCTPAQIYKPACNPHADGWATRGPSSLPRSAGAPVATREGFDSIIVSTVPSRPWAVGGYVAGSWPDFWDLVRAFPAAHHLSVAPFTSSNADCLDVEPGDATPGEAPAWARREIALGHRLVCEYTSISGLDNLKAINRAAGIPSSRIKWWCAWYRYVPGLVPGCDAVQWSDRALGRNLDADTFRVDFFGPPPPPPDPRHLLISPTHLAYLHGGLRGGPFRTPAGRLDERLVREREIGASQHPVKYRSYLEHTLAPELGYLADRLHSLACADKRNGSFNLPCTWSPYKWGSRYQYIVHAQRRAAAGK